jgi:hypothetical protein
MLCLLKADFVTDHDMEEKSEASDALKGIVKAASPIRGIGIRTYYNYSFNISQHV